MVASQSRLTLEADKLLSSNKWVTAWNARGRTALEIAAAAGYEDVVSHILGNTNPGIEAPQRGFMERTKPVVALLVNQLGVKSYNSTGAVHCLLTKFRLKRQTDRAIVARLKEAPISASAGSDGHKDVMEVLLDSLSAWPNADLRSILCQALNLASAMDRNWWKSVRWIHSRLQYM
jgi:hypothetical protein